MKASSGALMLAVIGLIALIMDPSNSARFIVVQIFVCTALICTSVEKAVTRLSNGGGMEKEK